MKAKMTLVPVDDTSDVLPPDLTEDSLAQAFTARYGNEFRFCRTLGGWQHYDGTVWKKDTTLLSFDRARALAREVATRPGVDPKQQSRLRSAATRAAIVSLAESDRVHAITQDRFDADPLVLNTPGGIVDLRTGTLGPSEPTQYCTRTTTVTPGGECQRWQQFLREVTGDDADMMAYLQRFAGYCLTGLTREHALVFVYGTGGNGKSVFLNTLLQMIGTYGQQAPMSMFEEKQHEGHPTELAMLRGARLVVATETEEGRRWAESRIKVMTGGDPITARFLYGDYFTYQPQFKPVIAGNHRPGFRNPDEAIRRRLHLVPFTQTFASPDRDLTARLRAEMSGILSWAIAGCLQWQARGLDAPASVRLATADYLDTQDSIGAWLAACTEVARDGWCASKDLFASWEAWAIQQGERPGRSNALTEKLTSRGFESRKERGTRGISGLRLLSGVLGIGAEIENGRSGRTPPISTSHARTHAHAHTRVVRLNGEDASTASTGNAGLVRVTWRNGEQTIVSADDRDLHEMGDLVDRIEPLDHAA